MKKIEQESKEFNAVSIEPLKLLGNSISYDEFTTIATEVQFATKALAIQLTDTISTKVTKSVLDKALEPFTSVLNQLTFPTQNVKSILSALENQSVKLREFQAVANEAASITASTSVITGLLNQDTVMANAIKGMTIELPSTSYVKIADYSGRI